MTFTDPVCQATGKKKYLSWGHAERDAHTMRRNGKRRDAKPFHCTACHHPHVGGSV